MPTLSSLLVQHGVTSMRVVEEAIARQVLHGGDLATNVLELGAVRERELTALLAESLGLPPAVGRLQPASPDVLRTIPVDLAVQHRVFPLDVRTGLDSAATGAAQPEPTLVIATAEPLAPAVAEQLSFALGVSLRQLAAPLVRIRQALAEHYGIALERRLSRLVKQLDARAEPSPAERVEPAPAAAAALPPEAPPPTASPAGADAAPPARVDASSSAQVDAASSEDADATFPDGVGAREQAAEAEQHKRSIIDDAPTVEALTSIHDEETVVAEVSLNEAVPTPRKPPLHELDDEPTVVAEYPIDLPSFRYLEANTPGAEALASRLAELAPRRGRAAAAPATRDLATADPGEESAPPGHLAAPQEEPAIEPAEPTPRPEELAPRLSAFAAGVHAAAPVEAAAPVPAPSGARPSAPGTHLLTGWLKRASAAPRARQDALPQATASHQRRPGDSAPATQAPVASAPAAPAPAAPAPAASAPVVPAAAALAPAASAPATPATPAPVARAVSASAPPAKGSMREAGRSAPTAQRRKGPFTLAMAEQELAAVDSSEAVLAILFDFAQQYFEYTVLFTVHGERAEGRNAAGPGAERERVTKITVPFERPTALARARALRAPLISALAGSAPDAELQRELGRKVHAAAVAVVPIVVRGRVVALVHGDDGAASVELSSIGDLIALAGLAAAVLERLILRKKLNRSGGAQEPAAPQRASAPPAEAAAPAQRASAPPAEAAAPQRASAPPAEAAAPLDEHGDELAKDGPLSLRTRAALLELSSRVRAASHGSPAPDAGSPPPAAHADLGVGEAAHADREEVEPQGPRHQSGWSTEDGGSGIDAVARAFGLRGTGVEAEPVPPDEGVAHTMAFSSTIPSAPALHTPIPGAEPQSRLGREASVDVVSGTAVTAPMMPAVTEPLLQAVKAPSSPVITASSAPPAIDEIPDLEIPAAPALSRSEDFDLGEPEEARTKRYSRPPWMLDSSITPGEEHRDAGPAPSSDAARPHWRRRTPVALEAAAAYPRPPSERRAAASPSPAGELRAEYSSLVQHVLAGGEAGSRAFAELVRNGETAISIVAARFPGPLRVDRQRFREQIAGPDGVASVAAAPPASQCGTLLELIVAIRRPALPFMTVRSSSPDPEVRFWATHVLGELPYPEAANALLPRLFDDSIAVRRIAVRSAALLIAAPPAGGPILQGLDHIARDREESPVRRLTAIETMAEIRSGSSVPALVSALSDPHEVIVEASARALLVIAREDHGRDARKWMSWWSRNGERHRIEWIIDALTHEKPAIRRAAIDELKGITREYFGYYEDLPRQEREAAQERYRAWWTSEGRSRFRTTG
ncbi:HEAT repeat domain-containing protein [Sorangium sp. So ce362]|uniref:HEAT repeat domain-containing protein n=1 Tax=Sorangium sp. So ce362 TaxID=3133303 RepID=UPI003F5FADD6